jgi:hypothetical protein
MLMINQDIRAKLRRRPEELERWDLILRNELWKGLSGHHEDGGPRAED